VAAFVYKIVSFDEPMYFGVELCLLKYGPMYVHVELCVFNCGSTYHIFMDLLKFY
jgi:hypothetical protein